MPLPLESWCSGKRLNYVWMIFIAIIIFSVIATIIGTAQQMNGLEPYESEVAYDKLNALVEQSSHNIIDQSAIDDVINKVNENGFSGLGDGVSEITADGAIPTPDQFTTNAIQASDSSFVPVGNNAGFGNFLDNQAFGDTVGDVQTTVGNSVTPADIQRLDDLTHAAEAVSGSTSSVGNMTGIQTTVNSSVIKEPAVSGMLMAGAISGGVGIIGAGYCQVLHKRKKWKREKKKAPSNTKLFTQTIFTSGIMLSGIVVILVAMFCATKSGVYNGSIICANGTLPLIGMTLVVGGGLVQYCQFASADRARDMYYDADESPKKEEQEKEIKNTTYPLKWNREFWTDYKERAETFLEPFRPKTLWKNIKKNIKTDALITLPYHIGRKVVEGAKMVLKPVLQVLCINWLGRNIRNLWRNLIKSKENPEPVSEEKDKTRRRLVDIPFNRIVDELNVVARTRNCN